MLTLIAYAFFCVFTLIQPDKAVVAQPDGKGAETIKVPFLDFPVEFAQFLIVGPAVLIGLLVYLHIFIGNLRAIPLQHQSSAMPFIFNMEQRFPRFIAAFLFYWLGPLVLWLFTRKAGPHGYLLPLLLITLATTSVMIFLQIRRAPERRRGHATSWLLWAAFIFCGLSTLATFGQQANQLFADTTRITRQIASIEGDPGAVRPPWLRGGGGGVGDGGGSTAGSPPAAAADPLDIESKGGDNSMTPNPQPTPGPEPKPSRPATGGIVGSLDRVTQQMQQQQAVPQIVQRALGLDRGLNLAGADLRNVDLSKRDLRGANLRGANMAGLNLDGIDLERAKLDRAILSGANLVAANLKGASLREASLAGANLTAARLVGADLTGAVLERATLKDAELNDAMMAFADLRGARGLTCLMLSKAAFWPDALRDRRLACGAPIPTPRQPR
jgi:hypothetical protein